MIKQKKKLCNNCNTEQFIWKNDKGSRYCKYCWYKSKESKVNKLIRKPINQKSKKRLVLDKAYSILRRKFMDQKPMCEAALPCCNGTSTDVHHTYAGSNRSSHFLDVPTWLSVCRSCHNWIHNFPVEARELDLLK
tara:strand:+ start:2905 stop:3309 length:405 start_codon:yes stop_codon:yes gene_type:complete